MTQTPGYFHVLAKPTGAVCNLDCTYCFFLSKEALYPESDFRMADDLLEIYLRQLLESQPEQVTHRVAGRRTHADGPGILSARDGLGGEVSPARASAWNTPSRPTGRGWTTRGARTSSSTSFWWA